MDRHDHGPVSEDAFSPEADACPFELVDLPCGCQDVHYACGYVDREHDHVACSGEPPAPPPAPPPGDRKVQALAVLVVVVLVGVSAVVSIIHHYLAGLWACLAVEIVGIFSAVRWMRPHL